MFLLFQTSDSIADGVIGGAWGSYIEIAIAGIVRAIIDT